MWCCCGVGKHFLCTLLHVGLFMLDCGYDMREVSFILSEFKSLILFSFYIWQPFFNHSSWTIVKTQQRTFPYDKAKEMLNFPPRLYPKRRRNAKEIQWPSSSLCSRKLLRSIEEASPHSWLRAISSESTHQSQMFAPVRSNTAVMIKWDKCEKCDKFPEKWGTKIIFSISFAGPTITVVKVSWMNS